MVELRHFMEVQMQRTSRVWKRMAVVAFLGLGSGIVNAQSPSGAQMTAERSWQLQSVLQSIDADRETWVNLLVSKWSAVQNPAVYDVAGELGSVARVAPAWQLYTDAQLKSPSSTSGTRNSAVQLARRMRRAEISGNPEDFADRVHALNSGIAEWALH